MTVQLVNQFSSQSVTRTISELSPGLKSLLSIEPSNHQAVSEIASNQVLLDECRKALPAIHANATIPAGPEGVTKIISSLFVMYPQPARSDAEWTEFWRNYHAVLSDQPMTALEAAKDVILKDAKVEFLPKAAKILEIAKMTPNRAVRAYDRAKAAVEYQAPVEREKLSPAQIKDMIQPIAGRVRLEPTQADKDRVKRMVREFIEQDEARKAKEKAKKSSEQREPACGVPDATGITPQLRQNLEERGLLKCNDWDDQP